MYVLSIANWHDILQRLLSSNSISIGSRAKRVTSHLLITMSFDRLPSLEEQPSGHYDEPYTDDPEFAQFTQGLSDQLFTLTSNVARLSDQVALLGTKRDNERLQERVHDLLEETREGFRELGEGIKKLQTWEDISVGYTVLGGNTRSIYQDNC